MRHKTYSEYKSTGIEWPSEIPSLWNMTKLRYVFSFAKGLTITKEHLQDEGVPCVNYGEVHSKYGFEVDPKVHALKYVDEKYLKSNAESLLSKGDLVFADTSEDLDGAGNFTQLITDDIVFAGYHTIIARPLEGGHNRFYAYLLDSEEVRLQIKSAVKGVKVFSITQEILRNISIWLPSEIEQFRISVFLDYEIGKIDCLIGKQEQLIEFLKEKRQAVISHSITKGLNANIKMKYSGIEWLGDVPEHWNVIKFSYCVSIRSGLVDPKSEQYKKYWLIAPNHIQSGEGRILNLETAEEQGAESSKYLCKKGEVIYSKIRPALAKVCISPGNNVLCSADMYPMTARSGLTNDYLSWFLLSSIFTRFAVNQADRVAMPKINRESLAECKIPFPGKSEQIEIAYYLQRITKNLDDLIVKSQESIHLLKERRSTLISAAVTGKIDVRNCQPDAKDVA